MEYIRLESAVFMWKMIATADKDQTYRYGAQTRILGLDIQIMITLEFGEWGTRNTWRPELMSGVFIHCSPPWFLRQGPSLDPRLHSPSKHCGYRCVLLCLAFTRGWGTELWFSCLHSKPFTHWPTKKEKHDYVFKCVPQSRFLEVRIGRELLRFRFQFSYHERFIDGFVSYRQETAVWTFSLLVVMGVVSVNAADLGKWGFEKMTIIMSFKQAN